MLVHCTIPEHIKVKDWLAEQSQVKCLEIYCVCHHHTPIRQNYFSWGNFDITLEAVRPNSSRVEWQHGHRGAPWRCSRR